MNVKRILVGLCGIWAIGIGARMCYGILAYNGTGVFHYPLFVVLFDFAPLCLLGLVTVGISLYDYYHDLRDSRLGDVM